MIGRRAARALAGLALAAAPLGVQPEPHALAGHWEGAFSREGAVQLVALDVSIGSDGSPRGTLDIPELGMFGEPLKALALETVELELACLYGEFSGRLHAEAGEIAAVNARWGPPVRLHLKRVAAPAAAVQRREVEFESGTALSGHREDSQAVRLAGTLLLPAGASASRRVPGLVALHGSDVGDRSAWEYRGLGETLARRGLAVLLFDRRGSGASGGHGGSASFDELAGDALAALAVLREQPEVRADRAGLFGASQGAWIAPLAVARGGDADFLVLFSAPGVGVHEQELQRVEGEARQAELPEAEVAAAVAFTRRMLEATRAPDPEASFRALQPQAEAARAATWAEIVQIPGRPEDLAWFGSHDHDAETALRRVACPVLAFYGGLDATVPPALNAPRLTAALAAGGNTRLTVKVWPDCGHDLERQRTLLGDDWSWPEHLWLWARKPPGLYEEVAAWVSAL